MTAREPPPPAEPGPEARWGRVKRLFLELLEQPPEARAALLARACAEDAALGREVGELLHAHGADAAFMQRSAAESLGWPDDAEPDWTGRRIGPYRILAEAGRGGLSRVFRAVRDDGEVERQVAIKLLHAGLGTEALLARFRAERRILARLAHPNIAHFVDAGATDDGLPYLVMEFVEGEPLDAWCESRALPLAARLELFRTLCAAVHHVHQNLLVHGDLKGGNVLVTPDGVVKLLDFGLAKLLDPAAPDTARPATLLLMTPGYASPEQLRGEALTTASDVWSLGALLHRLVTGTTPFHAAPGHCAAADATGDPERPSAIAARGSAPYAALAPALRGDLDTIVLKALKRVPAERYGSAQQLGDDLQRHLRGFPVEARPDSAAYRLRKFARRHAGATASAALAVLALLGGVAVASWQAHVANLERARAERHFEAVRQLSAGFLGDVYDAIAQIPGSTAARKLLVDRALEYLVALERDAADSIALRRDLGVAWERLGDVQGAYLGPSLGTPGEALDSYRRSLAIRAALVASDPAPVHLGQLLRIQIALAEALLAEDRLDEARPLVADGVRTAEAVLALSGVPDTPRLAASAYLNRGTLARIDGRPDEAATALQRARAIYETAAAADPGDLTLRRGVALAYGRLGELHLAGTGRWEEALGYYRLATANLDELLATVPDNVELRVTRAFSAASTGQMLLRLNRPEEALRMLAPAAAEVDRIRRADPDDVVMPLALGAILNLEAEAELQLGRLGAAERQFAAAAVHLREEHAAGSPDVRVLYAQHLAGLAEVRLRQARGLAGEARAARLREARELARRAVPLLEPIATGGSVVLEARRLLDNARAVLERSGGN